MPSRYQTTSAEGEFEPNSNEEVLRNLVGITSSADMDELELQLLSQLYDEVLAQNLPFRSLTVADLKHWHRLWLGNVYAWAGQERSVNLGKNGFQFATAGLLPGLLSAFERKCLTTWTPCSDLPPDELVHAIAVTHVELIVIHPFREGNGRLSRLLADVMAVQAGHEPLDYSSWEQDKPAYIGAIHAGFFRGLRPHGAVCGPGHRCWRCRPQRASLICGKRTAACCNRCSSCATFWPVSTAVELATDRSTARGLGALRGGTAGWVMR